MTDNAQFTLATFGIELTPTPAMRQGTQKVAQCPWCGTVVVWQKTVDRPMLGTCPCCQREGDDWLNEQLPLAGLSRIPAADQYSNEGTSS